MKKRAAQATSVLLAILLTLTTFTALPLGASAAEVEQSQTGTSTDLTVMATSNFFPGMTSETFTQEELSLAYNYVTVSFFVKSSEKLTNTQWTLTYDGDLLELNEGANTVTDDDGNTKYSFMPNAESAVYSFTDESINGVDSNAAGEPMKNAESRRTGFVTVTFKAKGSGYAAVNLKIRDLKTNAANVVDSGRVLADAEDYNPYTKIYSGRYDERFGQPEYYKSMNDKGIIITLSETSYVYDGSQKKPELTVKYGTKTLVKGTDYTVSYANNINVGTATVTATGRGSYFGMAKRTFKITAPQSKSIADCTITLAYTSYNYTGAVKKPGVTVKDGEKTLTQDTDYSVSYKNNVNAGTATAVIKGMGNYTGTANQNFTIKPRAISNATVTLAYTSYNYTGAAKKPGVTVKDGETELVKDTDYTVTYQNYINAGTATAVITGIGNYGSSVNADYTIKPKSIANASVTLNYTSYNYTGASKKPAPTVMDGEKELVKDTDYTVSYQNNINAGTATVVITGTGNYTESLNENFTIVARELSNTTVTLSKTSYEYDGKAKKPEVTVKDGDKTLTKDTDYTVAYENNVNVGTAKAKVTGKGNYSGTVSKNFTITQSQKKNIADCTVTLAYTSYNYTGTEKKPAVTVKDGDTTLTQGTDYTVAYQNNINAGTATAVVTGKGSYTGVVNKTFTIKPRAISYASLTLAYTSYTYNGTEKKPAVTVKDGETELVKDTDYTVTYKNNVNAGTASVIVKGIGNYGGSASANYTINPRDMSNTSATLAYTSYTYNGTEKKPAVTVKDGETELVKDTDFTVSYQDNVNAGTATAVITGKGNYTGSLNQNYTINPRDMSNTSATLAHTTYTYNGTAKKPAVTVMDGEKELVKDTDFTVSYQNNVNAGTATAVVTGKGNYTGSLNQNYTINARSLSNTTVTLSETTFEYDGKAKKPTVTVKDGEITLTKGTDYTVAYENNINVGTATVKVTGKGNYCETVTETFTITGNQKKSLTACTVTLAYTSYNYTGTAKKPVVTVKDGSATLTLDTDYTVAYANNINAGTATATVTGMGNYTDSVDKEFTINPRAMSNTTITLAHDSYTFNGSQKKPAVTVKDGSKTLTQDTDYTVTYQNNINAGTATAVVTGMGNYGDSATADFTINPKALPTDKITLAYTSYNYTGTPKKPVVTVKDGSVTLTRDYDYTVTYENNVNAGTATAVIAGKGNYTGSESKEFTINPRALTETEIELSPTSFEYDGTPKEPTVTVKDGEKTLVKDTDFTVAYDNNINVGTASAKVTGKGNYCETVNKTFTITGVQEKSITECTVTLAYTSYNYTGTAKKPVVTVKDGSATLTLDTDYTVAYANNINAGTATATVTGKGKYIDSVDKEFTINPRVISNTTITLAHDSYTFNGSQKKPAVTVKDGSKTLTQDTDYIVTYQNNINAGTATAVVTGMGNYCDSASADFTINPKALPTDKITLAYTSYNYTGTPKKPVVTVKDGSVTLTRDYDYTVTYENNVNAGTATAVIAGKGNYTGSENKEFTINPRELTETEIDLSPTSFEYDGTPKEPTVTVKDGERALVIGTDYTVSYTNNIYAGTATATVTGIGNYTGSQDLSFTITGGQTWNIADCSVTIPNSTYYYTGEAITPEVTVKDGETTLTLDTDYTVSYSNNTDIGTATVTVTGAGSYTGSKDITFTIEYEPLVPYEPVNVDITTGGMMKYYTFTPSSDMIAFFYSSGTKDTMGYLYDTDMTLLSSNDDISSSYNRNFSVDYRLTGGVTYIYACKFYNTSLVSNFTAVLEGCSSDNLLLLKSYTFETGQYFKIDYTPDNDQMVRFHCYDIIPQASDYYSLGIIRDSDGNDLDYCTSGGRLNDPENMNFMVTYNLQGGLQYSFIGKILTNSTSGAQAGKWVVAMEMADSKSIDNCDISLSTNSYTFDGSQKTPAVTVMDGQQKLTQGTDYTVSYSDNVNIGVATATVTGKGRYTGSVDKRFTIVRSKQPFALRRDNWNFTNSPGSFSTKGYGNFTYRELINDTYLNAFKENLKNDHVAYQYVFEGIGNYSADLDETWGGSCYGMAATEYLAKQGLIDPKLYSSSANSINDLSAPVNNSNLNSLINYYMFLQRTTPARISMRRATRNTDEQNINEIISLLETNSYVMVGLSLGHEIAAYGVEYGSYTFNGKSYDGRIIVSDPNVCSNDYINIINPSSSSYKSTSDPSIYFNSSTYDWIIPLYYTEGFSYFCSANGGYFNGVSADLCVANENGFFSYELAVNNSADLSGRMNTYEVSDSKTVSKVARTVNGKYGTVNGVWDDIRESDFVLNTGGDNKPVNGYDLYDVNSSYRITQNSSQKLSASLEYPDCLLYAASGAGTSAIFDKSGYVEINGAKSDYELTMVSDYDYATDWFSIDVKGVNAENASLTMAKEGYILTSDNLHNVKVRALNKDVTVTAEFSTASNSVLIYEIDENTIGLKIDADGNGIYETEISAFGNTFQISGSSAQNAAAVTADAAINENAEIIDRATKGKAK